jgi:hypothetical protein
MKLSLPFAAFVLLLTLIPACDLQEPEFIVYDSDGFSIALPTRQPATRSEQGPDGVISSVSAQVEDTKYLVVYWDLPMYLRGISDAQILESMSLGAGAWKANKHSNVTVAGLPGKEIGGETANGKHMLTRMLRTKDRVYLLTIGGGKTLPDTTATKRFFDSFRLHP